MNSIITINYLPPEMILHIVSKLPIDDIINCKLLNKSFYFLIKFNLEIKNLIISDNNIRNKSFYTKKLVDQISIHRFELPGPINLDKFFLNQKFPRLKFLYINCNHYEILINNSNSLNSLSRLEHLELIGLDLKYSKIKNFILDLPYLSTLNITNTYYSRLTIDCPQLKNFKMNLYEINPINFIHAKSIRFCELSSYQPFVTSFRNLEKFYCANTTKLNDSEFLSKLPHLNEILIDNNKTLFNDLIAQNKRQLNQNLKIYFMGVHFPECLPEFNWPSGISFAIDIELIDFFYRNLDRMNDYIPFSRCVEFSILERYFKDKLLPKLLNKFVNLGRLKVSREVIYYDKFNDFLNNYKTINELDLSSSLLRQDFFNQLPYCLTDLKFLYINQEPNILNFDFILCFKSLEVISIGLEVPLDIVERAFYKFKRLDQFIFFHLNNLIQVCSSSNKILYIAENKPIEFDNFDTLFRVLGDMKSC